MAAESQKNECVSAVIRASGRQYRVSAGDKIRLNKVDVKPGDSLTINEVLLCSTGKDGSEPKIVVGTPLVNGASVTLKVLRLAKEKKVRIFKKKRRTGYTKRQGHRQEVSEVIVESITLPA